MTINEWLASASTTLSSARIPSPQLDADILLAHTLDKPRTWLVAHSDDLLNAQQRSRADKHLQSRVKRLPIAYITGHKEFYGRDFIVSPDVLIPRPETEAMIELAKRHKISGRVLDIGCGSGCIGITLKLEVPDIGLTLADINQGAIDIARRNGHRLGAKPIRYVVSDLLEHWLSHGKPKKFDAIFANLPYVDKMWQRSPETDHEPSLALFADDNGLELIYQLIEQSKQLLNGSGHLVLEADPEQHQAIINEGAEHSFEHIDTIDYALLLKRPI